MANKALNPFLRALAVQACRDFNVRPLAVYHQKNGIKLYGVRGAEGRKAVAEKLRPVVAKLGFAVHESNNGWLNSIWIRADHLDGPEMRSSVHELAMAPRHDSPKFCRCCGQQLLK